MKKIGLHSLLFLLSLLPFVLHAQEGMHAKPGMGEGKFNYTSFTTQVINKDAVTAAANSGYEADPELGLIYKNAPCTNCYELIGKRTEINKTFVNKDDRHEIFTQTSTAPMHYKDADGRWRTIKPWLQPAGNGIYAATEQEAPITINTQSGYTSLGKNGQSLSFNDHLELLYEQPDGTIVSLGLARWNDHTAGDDGVYVTNAWPGIDIEMRTIRGAVKTNFWINRAMPQYAAGKLLVRDHIKTPDGWSLYAQGNKKFTGILEIRNEHQEKVYVVSTATAFEKNDGAHTLRDLQYYIGDSNTVDIALPGDFLNRAATAYPVIIDPLVSLGTSVTVPGSTYSPGWTVGCPILNPATVPADLTITDIQFTFEYLASGGALQTNGAMDFYLGACRNPALTGWYWYCLAFTPGLCGGANISLISDYGPCLPPVNCASYNLNITMNLYQSYLSTLPCSALYITATMPLTITVVGQTLNTTIPTPAPICTGQSVTLSSTTTYGMPPYTYSWSPGGATTPAINVSPSATTTYTLIVTDACGFMDTATSTVAVNPSSPIVGPSSVCIGTAVTLTNATAGGTWSCNNTAIATISATTGVLTGISTGTATITYTTAAGCINTLAITVVASPDPITGNSFLCTGSSTTLSNIAAGGTWSSSNTAVAVVSSTGLVTAVSAGTVVITYSMSAGCYSIFPMPIFGTPVISSTATTDPSTCVSLDGTIILNGLTAGSTYTVNYLFNSNPASATITANALGQVIITGLDGGAYGNITVTSANGCVSNPTGPLALNFPPPTATPVVTNSGPICAGDNISLTATCSTPGVTYSWTGPNGFTSTLQNPTTIPAYTVNGGAYVVTATALGCLSSPSATVVIVHPIPAITGTSFTNPSACFAADGTIICSGLAAGVSYSVTYTFNGTPASATVVADAAGNVTITGLTAGTYTSISMSSFTCLSNVVGPVTLMDPGAPPAPVLSSNAPVCEGTPLALYATDAMSGVTYLWTGPSGFSSTQQNPVIYNTTLAMAGTYTATAINAGCNTTAFIDINIFPGVILTNVTPSQSVIFGSTVQLNSWGAMYYAWTPDDGTLSNPAINDPVAHPINTTTYTVTGMNEWGCKDTASLTLSIEYTDTVLIPTAFTPNGDGNNDIFRIANTKDTKLVEFSIFNRWGQVVYNNTWNIRQGWDGTFNGMPADMGVYQYYIILARPNGENKIYKGDVTLIR